MDIAVRKTRGFSLVELVIVVVIIGIIGAIAIPRLSRGSAAASDNALRGDLAVLRRAIELYAAEHDNTFPAEATIANQLTQFTDGAGNTNATKTAVFIYGPYLKEIPPLPVGARKNSRGIANADAAGIGWIYVVNASGQGEIKANTGAAEKDASGTLYNTY